MKIINQVSDDRLKIQTTVYEFDNKFRVVHSLNKGTLETNVALISLAGSAFEGKKYAHGIAHFLEHLLVLAPNSKLKTRKEINEYESGNLKRPRLFINGRTNLKTMTIYGDSNYKGLNRIILRLLTMLEFKKDLVEQIIENEREVILSELATIPQIETKQETEFAKFMSNGRKEGELEFIHRPIGTIESIKDVKFEELLNFFSNHINTSNSILAIQSPRKLSKETIKLIEKLSNSIPNDKPEIKLPRTRLKKNKKTVVRYFNDQYTDEIFLSFNYAFSFGKKFIYKSVIAGHIINELLSYIGDELFRQDNGLIYSFETFDNSFSSFNVTDWGYKFIIPKNKLESALKLLPKYEEKIESFFNDKEFDDWLLSYKSKYLFPMNTQFNNAYADNYAIDLLSGIDLYDPQKARAAALDITKEEIYKYYSKTKGSLKPRVWCVSNTDDPLIEKTLKKYLLG